MFARYGIEKAPVIHVPASVLEVIAAEIAECWGPHLPVREGDGYMFSGVFFRPEP
jgi:hypothetical protein